MPTSSSSKKKKKAIIVAASVLFAAALVVGVVWIVRCTNKARIGRARSHPQFFTNQDVPCDQVHVPIPHLLYGA